MIILGNNLKFGYALNDSWTPYFPNPNDISIKFNKSVDGIFLIVTIKLPNPCINITWGEPERKNSTIEIHTTILAWTGLCIQVIQEREHTYEIKELENGIYLLNFYVNNKLIKSFPLTFPVPEFNIYRSLSIAIVSIILLFKLQYKRRRFNLKI